MSHNNKQKILELFFEEPSRKFQIREISRLTRIAHTSVKNHLENLKKKELIKKVQTNIYKSYTANEQDRIFKVYKQQNIILKLYSSGLVDYLEDKLYPRCIILFGSVRKGEYTKKSDIDLFIQIKKNKEETINITKYEKKLKHEINLFFEENINNLSNELFNNIINGIKISGYLKLK